MTQQSPDPDLKENNYRKWIKGQSIADLELELFQQETKATILRHSDPKLELDEQIRRIEEMRKEMLAKIKEKNPKKRAKARAEVESIIDGERADGPEWLDRRVSVSMNIAAVQDELQARRIQELSKGKADSGSAGARKLRRTDPAVAARRAVIRTNASLTTFQICEVLDDKKIDLPPGEEWETFREREDPWSTAYRHGGQKFRRRIRVIISKDKSA